MSRDSKGWGGLAAVGGAACVIACAAGPLLAAVAGGVALGAVLGVVAGAAALAVLVGIVALRVRRRTCETPEISAPEAQISSPRGLRAMSPGDPVRGGRDEVVVAGRSVSGLSTTEVP